MSIFDKLKGVFIIEDESAAKKAAEKGSEKIEPQDKILAKKGSTNNKEIEIPELHDPSPESQQGKPDGKFVDILLKAVEKGNLEGFDYLEYKSSLQSLVNMDMDEETRYKSALAMAKTLGATPDKLIKTAKHYLDILKQENTKFKQALKNQREKQVVGKETGIVDIAKSIEQKKRRIQELEKEIQADTEKMKKMKSGINQAAAKVQRTNDSFIYAYNVVTGQIQEDIEKIKKYLISKIVV